jgi:hypothetical protein
VTALGGVVLVLGVNPLNHGLFTLCVGLTGLVNSVCLTLCFMPPERYLEWLRRDTVGAPEA